MFLPEALILIIVKMRILMLILICDIKTITVMLIMVFTIILESVYSCKLDDPFVQRSQQ